MSSTGAIVSGILTAAFLYLTYHFWHQSHWITKFVNGHAAPQFPKNFSGAYVFSCTGLSCGNTEFNMPLIACGVIFVIFGILTVIELD